MGSTANFEKHTEGVRVGNWVSEGRQILKNLLGPLEFVLGTCVNDGTFLQLGKYRKNEFLLGMGVGDEGWTGEDGLKMIDIIWYINLGLMIQFNISVWDYKEILQSECLMEIWA